jgi:hypothetical protein
VANAEGIFGFSISGCDTEIIVNAGMTDLESTLLDEDPRNEELMLASPGINHWINKVEIAVSGVKTAPHYQK